MKKMRAYGVFMNAKRGLLILLAVVAALACLSGCSRAPQARESAYGVFLGVDPQDADKLAGYETVVIDATYYTKAELAALRENGAKTIWSYLNIGSIETFRDGYDAFRDDTLAPYENWPDEYWMDVSLPAWQSFIADCAAALAEKGVDGFFLDNADVYYFFPTDEIFNALTEMVGSLESFGLDVIVNGGDVFVERAVLAPDEPLVNITGVNQECVFTNIDFSRGRLVRQDAETKRYYQDYLNLCAEKGLRVFLTEYAGRGGWLERKIDRYCENNGFFYYLSPSAELDG